MMDKKIEVGDIVSGYEIKYIYGGYAYAEGIKKMSSGDYVVWHINYDGTDVYYGKYFDHKADAEKFFSDCVYNATGIPF